MNVKEPKKSQEIIQPDTIILKGLEMYRFIFSFSEIFLSMHLKKNYEPNKNVCPFFAVSGFLCVMEDTTNDDVYQILLNSSYYYCKSGYKRPFDTTTQHNKNILSLKSDI